MFDIKSKDIDDEEVAPGGIVNRLVIWLGVFSLGLCFMPTMLIGTTLRTHEQAMSTEVFQLQETLAAPPIISDESQRLSQTLITSQTTLKQLTTLQTQLAAEYMDWTALMGSISRYNPITLVITSLNRAQHQITLVGQSQHETDVMFYVDSLRVSGLFSQVTIQSLVTNSATTSQSIVQITPTSEPFPVSFVLVLTVASTLTEKVASS